MSRLCALFSKSLVCCRPIWRFVLTRSFMDDDYLCVI
jgi:hypothetical protein